jgi:hypothetical protein
VPSGQGRNPPHFFRGILRRKSPAGAVMPESQSATAQAPRPPPGLAAPGVAVLPTLGCRPRGTGPLPSGPRRLAGRWLPPKGWSGMPPSGTPHQGGLPPWEGGNITRGRSVAAGPNAPLRRTPRSPGGWDIPQEPTGRSQTLSASPDPPVCPKSGTTNRCSALYLLPGRQPVRIRRGVTGRRTMRSSNAAAREERADGSHPTRAAWARPDAPGASVGPVSAP